MGLKRLGERKKSRKERKAERVKWLKANGLDDLEPKGKDKIKFAFKVFKAFIKNPRATVIGLRSRKWRRFVKWMRDKDKARGDVIVSGNDPPVGGDGVGGIDGLSAALLERARQYPDWFRRVLAFLGVSEEDVWRRENVQLRRQVARLMRLL